MTKQESFMQEAINLSKKSIKEKFGGPFGAIIVKNWKIIWKGYNHVVKNKDPSAHWEIMAIRDACKNIKSFDLSGCEIYTSCEPCPMCLWAIYRARIEKMYYANTQEDADRIWFDDCLFYEELEKKPENRKLKIKQIMHKEARKVFEERKKEVEDIKY